jgi:16S rRNA processing protein RimM
VPPGDPGDLVPVGRVVGAYGVLGWLRVVSDCDPPANLLSYSPWFVAGAGGCSARRVEDGRPHGKGVVARIEGCASREQAQAMAGATVAVRRGQLPPLPDREYYWVDLIGMRVVTQEGTDLGEVRGLLQTGANDVLVVQGERERLVPFVLDAVVLEVDPAGRRIRVDWDPTF